MKPFNNRFLVTLLVIVSFGGYIISCTHDNELPPPPASKTIKYTRGNDVFLPGNMTAGNPTEWKMDKTHSSVLWVTPYKGIAGSLTGRFDQFGMHNIQPAQMVNTYYYSDLNRPSQPLPDSSWAFYENDDSKTYLNGYVQINTSNTGEPGRDGTFDYTTGCNLGAMGTTAKVRNYHNLTVSNIAQIRTTKVTFDETTGDYIVNFDFTWKGKLAAPLTQQLVGRLKYIKKQLENGGAGPNAAFGLQLKFQFNCRDFGVTSTSVSDKIDIECNMNFNNK